MKKRYGTIAVLLFLCMGAVGCGKNVEENDVASAEAVLYIMQDSEDISLNSVLETRLHDLMGWQVADIDVNGDVDYTKTGIYPVSVDVDVKCYYKSVTRSYDIQIAIISQEEADALGEGYVVYTSGGRRNGEETDSPLPDDGVNDEIGGVEDTAGYEQIALEDEDFTESFTFYNYEIGYPPQYISGWSSTRGSNYQGAAVPLENSSLYEQGGFRILYYAETELDWLSPSSLTSISDESDLENSVELCEKVAGNCVALAVLSHEQFVETSEAVNINGMDMLKVTGTIQDYTHDKCYDYVAYYFAIKRDGKFYPAFALGMPTTGTLEDVEMYLDVAMKHMSKIE